MFNNQVENGAAYLGEPFFFCLGTVYDKIIVTYRQVLI